MHKIYQFSQPSGEGEFLIISEQPREEVLKGFLPGGFQLDHVYTIEEDATGLPCDQELACHL